MAIKCQGHKLWIASWQVIHFLSFSLANNRSYFQNTKSIIEISYWLNLLSLNPGSQSIIYDLSLSQVISWRFSLTPGNITSTFICLFDLRNARTYWRWSLSRAACFKPWPCSISWNFDGLQWFSSLKITKILRIVIDSQASYR